MTDPATVARAFLSTMEARAWDDWEALLHPDVVYELPQSRERITGRAAYRSFNEQFPGEWHLAPKVVIGDGDRAVVWFTWTVGADGGDGQVFLDLDAAGLVTRVTDFWPEPYDPPERPAGLVERW